MTILYTQKHCAYSFVGFLCHVCDMTGGHWRGPSLVLFPVLKRSPAPPPPPPPLLPLRARGLTPLPPHRTPSQETKTNEIVDCPDCSSYRYSGAIEYTNWYSFDSLVYVLYSSVHYAARALHPSLIGRSFRAGSTRARVGWGKGGKGAEEGEGGVGSSGGPRPG
jgi:hypothetical protein